MALNVKIVVLIVVVCVTSELAFAQKITLNGKVTDANTNEPLAYATIAVKGTAVGTHSDFNGNFNLQLTRVTDSVTISSIGYLPKSVFISNSLVQTVNIQLQPSSHTLQEVRIGPKGYINPAWAIMKEVIHHKIENDPRRLQSYQYESYSRIELDANHLSEKLLKKKFIENALTLADSLKITNADKIPVLPLFLSETISNFYYQAKPEARKEEIKHTKTNGIGFEDGTLLAQLTGSTFQQYNFYNNFVSAAGKDFVSPLSANWRGWYDYELDDRNAMINGKACYQISFKPRRPQDLAFTGTIWIAHENYALYQVKATISSSANLNFIHQISVQQQMETGQPNEPWLPEKTRILVEVDRLTDNSSGLLAKLYTFNKNKIVNKVYPPGFFKERITIADNAQTTDDHYWDVNRPDSLTRAEKSVYHLIDTVKAIPTVRNYLMAADLLINGYYRAGDISIGPILNSYSFNNVEGNRLRIGFKTNSSFNKRWILGGYLGYGTKDLDVKFGSSVDYIFSRKHWTEAGISFTHDLNQVALLSDSYLYQRNNLFSAFTHFGKIDKRKVFDQNILTAYLKRDLFKGFTEKVSLSNWSLDPQFIFQFNDPQGGISNQMVVSELQLETQWSPARQPLLSETVNRPISLKSDATAPIFTFRYTMGLKSVLGGDFSYQKFSLNVSQTLKFGGLGRGKYSFSAGYIPSSVPYPLLENHLGNETFIYNPNAFNLMRFFEFASDKYASLSYTQHFEGLLLNSLPLIKKFKWRLVGTANVLYGGISENNKKNILNNQSIALKGLNNRPYIEAGYGIENIFKFLRVDFIHRVTYRNNMNSLDGKPRDFGIKVSAQIRL